MSVYEKPLKNRWGVSFEKVEAREFPFRFAWLGARVTVDVLGLSITAVVVAVDEDNKNFTVRPAPINGNVMEITGYYKNFSSPELDSLTKS